MPGRVKSVDIGIQHKEGIGVPELIQELVLPLQYGLAGKALGQPGRAAAVKIPPYGICAEFFQSLKGIHHIALGLAHLLAVLVRHQTQNNDIFIRRLVEQQRGLRQQGVEPSSGLVHGLGDEFRRELLLEQIFIFKRIMMLRKRHGPGVKPTVDHLGHPLHGAAALGAGEGHFINVRPVKLHLLGVLIPGQIRKLLTAAHGHGMPALAFPDI